ncbi:phosphoribosylanthranilate isomerase [Gangjinia marincola]|uniref:N-(5'-phosphoribosyl)anthranilate isomerase n=2 Tax=Gangjinia marincola TaxID=578463 RepID=A0ABN1MJK7_9FLAO
MNMKLKICGIKHNPTEVASLSPDYMGFIFYDKSPRYVAEVPEDIPLHIQKVGVFVNASVEDVVEKTKGFGLAAIQLHGDESVEYIELLRHSFRESEINVPEIWKVFGIKDQLDIDALRKFESVSDKFLFDTKGASRGGNGVTFDWQLLKNYNLNTPYWLSGGIGLEEMKEVKIFSQTKAAKKLYGIDINSKVEISPGLKDKKKIHELKTCYDDDRTTLVSR